MNHMTDSQIRTYVIDDLPYEERLEFETHLATCKECAARVRVLLAVSENIEEIWRTWTVKKHAEEFHLAHLQGALRAASAEPRLQQRLMTWAENITTRIEAVLGLSIDVSKRAVEIAQEGLAFLQEPRLPQFTPVPIPVSIAGKGHEPTWVAVETQSAPSTRVTIDPAARRILVQLQIHPVSRPLVALVARDYNWVAVASFRAVEGEEFLLAELEDIPSGEFVLLIEKLCGSSTIDL